MLPLLLVLSVEDQVDDPAGDRDGLDLVVLLERLESVPQSDATAEHDRYLDHVHVVDQAGREKVAHDGRAASDADVPSAGRLTGGVERLRKRGVEEVERGATLHLDRSARAVSEYERGGVKRWVRPPPPLPVGVVLPARWAELARAHDLGADPRLVLPGERVVDAGGAPGASHDRGTEARGDHPLVQPMAGVTEGRFECLTVAGRETVQRDGEVVNAGPCHLLTPTARLRSGGWRLPPTARFIGPSHKFSDRDRVTGLVLLTGSIRGRVRGVRLGRAW